MSQSGGDSAQPTGNGPPIIRLECPFCDLAGEGDDLTTVVRAMWDHGQAVHVLPDKRVRAYAAKFRAEHGHHEMPEPTDAALAEAFAGCVRPPRPNEYNAIRAALEAW